MSYPLCGCGETWSGTTAAHCAASGCHQTFTTVANFDRHRRGGACQQPTSVGLRLAARAGYQAWAQPGEENLADRLRSAAA